MPNIPAAFPKSYNFLGIGAALSPELNYTFPSQRIVIGFNPVMQFFKVGYENERIENPTFTDAQRRSEGISLELFGEQVLSFDLRVAFKI